MPGPICALRHMPTYTWSHGGPGSVLAGDPTLPVLTEPPTAIPRASELAALLDLPAASAYFLNTVFLFS